MKKILVVSALIMVLAIFSASANAQNITKGFKQVELVVNYDPDTYSGSEFYAEGSYGYFFRDYLMVGVGLAYLKDDYVTAFNPQLFAEKLFPVGSPFVPFVTAGIGYYSSDIDIDSTSVSQSAFIIGGGGGVKYFVNESVAIQGRARYLYATDDVFSDKDDASDTDFRIDVGIIFYF